MNSTAGTFGGDFRLTLITDDERLAAVADAAGVNRIGIDLERLGKPERQREVGARISRHTWDDLSRLSPHVRRASLFVRINPIHDGTEAEIETALALGAGVLMLPSFRTPHEATVFVRMVRGRALAAVLVELAPAVVRIREILKVSGIDEVMIGLNDLHLQLRLANHFEVLASPLLDMLAAEVSRRGLPLSIGGAGRVGDTTVPVPVDLVLAQYPRLHATGAWLSRSFVRATQPGNGFPLAVTELRLRLDELAAAPPEFLEQQREELMRCASQWRPT